jgi:phage/plasmid-like protein (TIGR03299 family)
VSDYFTSGFSVREPMWHNKGVVLSDYPDLVYAPYLAGHNFTVIEKPVTVGGKLVEDWKAIVRDDTEVVLHMAKDTYAPVQNSVGWDIVETLVGRGAKVETAGVLKDGAICWIMLLLDEPQYVPGDLSPTLPWMLLHWSHDGSGAWKIVPTKVRVQCANTLQYAEKKAKKDGVGFRFRHTGNVVERIEAAKGAILKTRQDFQQYIELATDLANTPITVAQREQFVRQFIPMPEAEGIVSDRVVTNIRKARGSVNRILDGRTIPEEHKLTAYGLFQAGIEYLDWYRQYRNSDTLFARQLLTRDKFKDQLLPLVREVAAS